MAECGELNISRNNLYGREFILKRNRYLIENSSIAMDFLRTQIASLNKKSLKKYNKFSN